jgi:hypothetical protein
MWMVDSPPPNPGSQSTRRKTYIEYYFVEKKIKMSVFKREIDLHFSQFEEI